MTTRSDLPLKHWGLQRWPFPADPQVNQVYPTEGQQEAQARIEHLVDSRRRLGVVLGGSGVGKSLLLHAAARKLSRAGCQALVVGLVGVSTREMLWQICAGFGAAPAGDADIARLWRIVVDRVRENRLQQIHTVLFLDDAGQAGPDILTQLIRLTRIDPAPRSLWTMILSSEASQAHRWNESLLELVDLRIELPAWELADTIGYVQTSLVDAGCLEPVFDQEALRELHELSGGVARKVARLADFALLAGAAAETTTIDATLVRTAHQETNWATAALHV